MMPSPHPVVFYLLCAYVLFSAWGVIRQQNLFHAGISLISCFLGVAGIYVTLGAPFLAGMQVLIYAGAIAVVLLFAFMLTHDLMHAGGDAYQKSSALAAALTLGAIFTTTVWVSPWWSGEPHVHFVQDYRSLAQSYMTTYLVPLQMVALLLLITLMGAVVIARKEELAREVESEEKA